VLIATPGRLLDHFERGKLILSDVKIMVVDEADRMLDMGFIPDIEEIFKKTPFTRQTLFFSATMAPEIERITNTFLSAPVKIEVARAASANVNIAQSVVMFKGSRREKADSEKRDLLRKLIEEEGTGLKNAIIFCNRKSDVDIVAKSLNKHGLDAAPIHGDLEQSQRMRTLDDFRTGTLKFLVASDVAARGLDIPDVSHVFNFDVPSHAEDYIHRIGRTGRAGKKGITVMICNPRDEKNLADVERLIENEIPRRENLVDGPAPVEDTEKPAEQTEEKPKRTRTRSRKKDDTPKPQETVAEAPEAEIKATPAAKEPAKAAAPAPAEEKQDNRPAPRQANPRRDRGGRGNDRQDRGQDVVGMGDDVPAFIAKSFVERAKD